MGIFSQHGRAKGKRSITTLIAEGCSITGHFKVENNIQVDGSIDGQLHIDKTLVISESGKVSGEVYAEHIVVNGQFDGTCYADKIEILSKGHVNGTIYSDDLSIEHGGRFNGVTHPTPEQQVVDLKEAKVSSEKQAAVNEVVKNKQQADSAK
ncbi:polymer-forming cytoskeletal family protein [Vibrio sp. CAIM 722]|uniref:Polymer-forming cytoskeletal family protein n=2 Tax=Vibrio TaxID=662 RepID=A0A7X4RTS9_9VIBR|nr:polymer-forming cytoskeletal protein [Vibrio eleionomae]MBF9003391.1 polymer-forming cytoskeletal protein [Vibrio nitrifigilis]MZI93156.1 polymer-forming cytoskeletal family protein [Vibrio eleionomae]